MINFNHIDIERRNENVFNLLEKAKAGTLAFSSSVSDIRKSELIESLLVGVPPLPLVCVKSVENGRSVITVLKNDKCLMAVKSFVDGEFALSGCRVINGLDGKRFDELHPAVRRSVFETRFDLIVVRDVYKDKEAVDFAIDVLTCEG